MRSDQNAGRITLAGVAAIAMVLAAGCGGASGVRQDRPRLRPGVTLRDVVFRSAALGREMRYRVLHPAAPAPGRKLPVVYLLHGGGGTWQEWSNHSDVARFALDGLILVMPQGDYSYYVNSTARPQERYEDYIAQDLLADVEARFPAAATRERRAIVGVSMGGFGAIKIALSHPGLFGFAGALSAAVDVPRRPFSIRRVQQYRAHRALFGPWDSAERRARDPFLIAPSVQGPDAPYFYLVCGDREGLLPANRAFAALLRRQNVRSEFHVAPGGHDWNQWNAQLAALFARLRENLGGTP